MGFASIVSGNFVVVTCYLDNRYCTLLIVIAIVNSIMIVIHDIMCDRKQFGGKVRPD